MITIVPEYLIMVMAATEVVTCSHLGAGICAGCAAANPEVVGVGGRYFWLNDPVDRALVIEATDHAAILAEIDTYVSMAREPVIAPTRRGDQR